MAKKKSAFASIIKTSNAMSKSIERGSRKATKFTNSFERKGWFKKKSR